MSTGSVHSYSPIKDTKCGRHIGRGPRVTDDLNRVTCRTCLMAMGLNPDAAGQFGSRA